MLRSSALVAVATSLLMATSAIAADAPKAADASKASEAKANESLKPSAFTPAQREELKKLIHDYIVQNPDVLADGMVALEKQEVLAKETKQKEAVTANSKALKDSPEGTVLGNPKGDVTLVEFFDYNCGYCKAFFPSLLDTIKKDGKLRVVLKEFPILGPSSLTASQAALAAVKQNKYSEFHIAMMNHKGSLTDDVVMEVAKGAGLNMERLQADMKAKDIATVLDKNQDLARSLSVNGTPSIIVGDSLSEGAITPEDLKELIAAARKKS